MGLFGNTSYGTEFATFSPLRLFTPVGSNITEALFFIPGTQGTVRATVNGFGAVFTVLLVARIRFFLIDFSPETARK